MGCQMLGGIGLAGSIRDFRIDFLSLIGLENPFEN